ncbi:MAG: choice-of-anchor J domain-containing protein [Bacteroidia bacterium]|nr:choice-of-anchor J domain-containing protein [Bacteroidia bacterium]
MKKVIVLLILAGLGVTFNACKKKPDEPPVSNYLGVRYYGVPELRALATSTNSKEFTADHYFAGVVVADQVSGNFYKEIYVRDRYNTGGLRLDLLSSACNFFIGDSVRLNLNGYDIGINPTSGMLEIDSIDCEKAIVKFGSGPAPQPRVVNLAVDTYTNYLCDLIAMNDVAFIPMDTNQIWADAVMQSSLNRIIQDCSGNQITVRTSNYASFASQKTPKGAGTIIGVATIYGTTNQMTIRTPNELNMNGAGCVTYLKKDFNDASITSGGWTQQALLDATVTYYSSTHTGYANGNYAKISGFYSSTSHNAETWLISPSLNLSAGVNPILSFVSMANFSGNALEVLVSTNYTSGLPSTATWINLSGFNLSSTGYALTPSGLISLNAYKTANTRIAFKYTSTSTASKTFEVDDIIIREN